MKSRLGYILRLNKVLLKKLCPKSFKIIPNTRLILINIFLAIILIIAVLLQRSEGGALGLGVSQDNFTSSRSVGTFLTKLTAIIASLFIICSIILVAINRDEIRKTQSVLELEEEKNSDLPQIPETNK